MKLNKKLLPLGFIFALVLSSCTMEKRLYSSGYHIEWLNGKNSPEKLNANVKSNTIEENTSVKESKIISSTNAFNNSFDLAVNDENTIASAESNKIVLSTQKHFSFQNTGTPVKAGTIKEMKKEIKQSIKKSKKITSTSATEGNDKSLVVAVVLWFFLGGLGIHRFYLGYTGMGLLYLFTGALCGIGWIIDGILFLTGGLPPKNGKFQG